MKTIALFSDKTILPGLHVTLLSLLYNLNSQEELQIVIFADKIPLMEKKNLFKTHSLTKQNTTLKIIDYSPESFAGANSLHGNFTAYGRLFLSQLLPEVSQCLYLDADLVVNGSVLPIFDLFDGKRTLIVGGAGDRNSSLDKKLFIAAGLNLQGPCFNSGVLGIDLELWRKRGCDRKCQEVAEKYRGMFLSADQALLNIVFNDDFKSIGITYNRPLYPSTPYLEVVENNIYHFVGAPKPWDILGSWLHQNYNLWHIYYKKTSISKVSLWRYASVKRIIRISRMMLLAAKAKLMH